MEFSIETSEFQKAVKLLRVSARPNSDDVSGRATIEAKNDNTATLFATNTYTSIGVECPAEVETPGEVIIPYGKIISFVTSYLPWDEDHGVRNFKVKATGSGALLAVDNVFDNGKSNKGRLKLGVFQGYGSPKPKPFDSADFILNSNIFKRAVSKIIYAVDANHAQKSALQGMFVQFTDKYIYFAGANGAVISEFRVNNSSDLKDTSVVLRHDFIMGLKTALSEETQLFWDINSDTRHVKVRFDNVNFSGRKIIGSEFPDYRKAFDSFKNVIRVEKRLLTNAIDPFVGVLDDTDNYRLTLDIKERKLSFICDAGNAECDTNVDFNEDFSMDLNGRLLKESIESIQDDIILVKFSERLKPLILDSGNFEDQKSIVVPLRGR